jgi:hypothetical protein
LDAATHGRWASRTSGRRWSRQWTRCVCSVAAHVPMFAAVAPVSGLPQAIMHCLSSSIIWHAHAVDRRGRR